MAGLCRRTPLAELAGRKPWTTLWVDGNHENFDRLHTYPATEWHGGKIQKITPHIFHLCRGQVFQLENRRIFTMGGAESRDKEYRRAGVSWWAEELPAETELRHAREALEHVNWNVDVVISHCLSTKMQQKLFKEWNYPQNRLTDFFQELDEKLDFRLWFSGHYHLSKQCDPRHVILYDAIVAADGKRISAAASAGAEFTFHQHLTHGSMPN
ncbi:MAG: metallophosphoesterase [Ruminococcus callidus]